MSNILPGHIAALDAVIMTQLKGVTKLDLLEAGGGSWIKISLIKRIGTVRVTTIDICQEQIDKNDYADVKIVGDLSTDMIADEAFDLVVCYNVIEHIDKLDDALANICKATKVGGLVVIGAPNPASLAGLITKYTPHFFHVLVYRYIFGSKKAGNPGEAPFKTTMRSSVSPKNLIKVLNGHGMEVVYFNAYENDRLKGRGVISTIWSAVCRVIEAVSLFRYNPRLSDYHVVCRKVAKN
jgi:2-polyprenyl-3-methyl-5-hydroxy-6-metoxy-1,4-benzoquinol methylase